MNEFYQQGDVIIEKVDSVEGQKIDPNGVLAEGGATGHAHRIADLTGLDFYEKDGVLYLKANKSFSIVHEEHKEQTIPSGNFKIGRVKEYDHFSEEARNVID